jgi:hypothetical protein
VTDSTQSDPPQIMAPPPRLVTYIIASSVCSVALFLLALACPLNVVEAELKPGKSESNVGETDMKRSGALQHPDSPKHRHLFLLATVTMFAAGMTGGCLSNIRRIIQHTIPGPFQALYCLSYYIRPLYGGIAGIVVFFLLLGGTLTFGVGTSTNSEVEGWMTIAGRAPYIAFSLLAGYGSKEFSNKLADLADSLFALSNKKVAE